MRGRGAGETTRARIIASIETLTLDHQRPPTVRELGDQAGIGSTGHLSYHLRILEDSGVITRTPGTSRGVRLADGVSGSRPRHQQPRSAPLAVPLRGRIAAGQPIEAVEDVEATLDLGATLARRGGDLYALRVVGTSMMYVIRNTDSAATILSPRRPGGRVADAAESRGRGAA